MSQVKLVMVDLDGTILIDHKNISKATEATIDYLLDNGVSVVPTTGRYFSSIPKYFTENGKFKYVVSSNGALITNNTQDIFKKTIDFELALKLLAKAEEISDHAFVVTNKGVVMNDSITARKKLFSPGVLDMFTRNTTVVKNIAEHIAKHQLEVKKLEFIFNDTDLRDRYLVRFENIDEINTVSSSLTNIEITAKGASKGSALHFLKDHLELDISQVLAIGDSSNDITMLKEAGISVAMGNATKEVMEISSMVTDSVDNEGFTKAIKKVFNL